MNSCDDIPDLSGTYIFVSFDLVNATAFKLIDSDWPLLFNGFFDYCRLKMHDYFPRACEWKMIGDEILFYMAVTDSSEVLTIPEKMFETLKRCISYIESHTAKKAALSVKATLWGARVAEQRHFGTVQLGNCHNYLLRTGGVNGISLDFLGPDIDAGFRITRFAHRGILVIGAVFARTLIALAETGSDREMIERLRIVSYEQLKGVWDSRRYPIIWYHDQWRSPDSMFLYDDQFTSPVVANVIAHRISDRPNILRLVKVFDDLGKNDEISGMIEGIDNCKMRNSVEVSPEVMLERLSELHLVAMCTTPDNRLFIARRNDSEKSRGLWEFGLGLLQMYKTIDDSLSTAYRDDFGLELQAINGEFPPVATYSIHYDTGEKSIPGIMVLARVIPETFSLERIDRYKYCEARWVSESESAELPSGSCVPGFHDRVKAAFKRLAELECGR